MTENFRNFLSTLWSCYYFIYAFTKFLTFIKVVENTLFLFLTLFSRNFLEEFFIIILVWVCRQLFQQVQFILALDSFDFTEFSEESKSPCLLHIVEIAEIYTYTFTVRDDCSFFHFFWPQFWRIRLLLYHFQILLGSLHNVGSRLHMVYKHFIGRFRLILQIFLFILLLFSE